MHSTASSGPGRVRRGFGVIGSLPPDLIRTLAAAAEAAGYATFWANDGPEGEGLMALAEAATVTSTIQLAVGAIPLDRMDGRQIASRIAELALPEERLIVGAGSGGAAGGLARVRDGFVTLRALTGAQLVAAAMGPKMCALAGEIADGVLFDWVSPAYAERARGIALDAADAADRPVPWTAAYIFTALGDASAAKLREQAAYYAAIPAYAAHFERMGAGPLATTTSGDDHPALQKALSPFSEALDELVVRPVVAQEDAMAYLEVLHAAAPA